MDDSSWWRNVEGQDVDRGGSKSSAALAQPSQIHSRPHSLSSRRIQARPCRPSQSPSLRVRQGDAHPVLLAWAFNFLPSVK